MITREAKIGLLMVAVLVGVFGFLVYKRIHRPMEALGGETDQSATFDPNNLAADNETTDPFQQERPAFRRRETPRIVNEFEEVAEKVERKAKELVEEAEVEVTSFAKEKRRPERARIVEEFVSEDDQANPFDKAKVTKDRRQDLQVPEPTEDAFDNVRGQLEPPRSLPTTQWTSI